MEKEILNKIGKNIRAERARKGFSQEELAEKADTTRRTICLIENGQQHPKVLLIARIAKALNVDINEFLKL